MSKSLSLSRKIISIYEKIGIVLMLLIEFTVFSICSTNFFNVKNIFLIGRQVSFLGIAAVGMTAVLLVGEIDISVGSILAFTGCLAAKLSVENGFSLLVAFIITILASIFIGSLTGSLVSIFKIPSLIATLAMQTIIRGCTYLMTGGSAISNLSKSFKLLGQGFIFGILPVPLLIMLIFFLLGYLLLNRTFIGRRIYAVGGNSEAARLSGIKTKRIFIFSFILSAFTSGIAGVLMAGRLGTGQPSTGSGFEMDVLTAVVLGGVSLQGGKGSILNVFLGSIVIGILSNGLVMMGVIEYWQWIIKGIVFIFAVAMSNLGEKGNR